MWAVPRADAPDCGGIREKYQEEHEIHKEYYIKAINHIKNIENR